MTADLFAVLSQPRSFEVDITELEKRYFAAQRLVHPDRLRGKGPGERQQAVSLSMTLNEAYENLKNPLKRARHLLELAGVHPESIKPSQELLMEIMDLREVLMEAETNEALRTIAYQNEEAQQRTLEKLTRSFADNDYSAAAELTQRLSYLVKLEVEIQNKIKTLENV